MKKLSSLLKSLDIKEICFGLFVKILAQRGPSFPDAYYDTD